MGLVTGRPSLYCALLSVLVFASSSSSLLFHSLSRLSALQHCLWRYSCRGKAFPRTALLPKSIGGLSFLSSGN